MRKRLITYVIVFIWIVIAAALVIADYVNWSNERRSSAYLDGCAEGSRFYLIENVEDDGILYVTDPDGRVQNVTRSGAIWDDSRFGKVAYAEGLYGVLTKKVNAGDAISIQYRIASFDESGSILAMTPVFQTDQEGILSGFAVDHAGFYLTLVMDSGGEAGTYLVEREKLFTLAEVEEEERDIPELKLYELTDCEEGRFIVEARYEAGRFLLHKDDGSGAEAFGTPAEIQRAFNRRELTVKQWLKLRSQNVTSYVRLFVIGCAILALIFQALRNRNHTVYSIVIVEIVLLAITFVGTIQVFRIQKQARREEARRFGYYYIQTLAEEMGLPGQLVFEDKKFYSTKEYYELRNLLSRFVNMDDIADVFMDICLVRSADRRILVSASGYNGLKFDEVYAAASGNLSQEMGEGARKAGTTVRVNGERYQILGVAASNEVYPEYLLIGIARQEDTSGVSVGSSRRYLIYAELVFLLGSLISVVLLVLQDRELRRLERAIHYVAGGGTQVVKGTVYGKDVNLMWNSLMEIDKTISNMNYTQYRIYESCYRFAPKNIEKILGKDSITEVKGGSFVRMQGTIAELSSTEPEGSGEKKAGQMNQFIAQFEKYQEKSEGFFISGQCNLAMMKLLFLEESRNTVESGAAFMHEFYGENSLSDLKTSIFLHYSQFTYGVAGTDKQSFPFLLSLEGQEMERYGAWFRRMGLRMVITESVRNRENIKGKTLRYIGYIRIPGMSEQIRLYEVLDAYPYRERHLKEVSDVRFQKAIELFYRQDFYLARSIFSDVLKDNSEDHIAKWYLFTCEKYLNEVRFDGDICRLRWEE